MSEGGQWITSPVTVTQCPCEPLCTEAPDVVVGADRSAFATTFTSGRGVSGGEGLFAVAGPYGVFQS